MPMRVYECPKCEHEWEELVRNEEEAPSFCPICENPDIEESVKGFTPAHVYKGKGFYTTDYKKRGK
jgi:putative FmdB family regulatory protein